jgi:glycosyltransferase involved in cell wall biosynthesis
MDRDVMLPNEQQDRILPGVSIYIMTYLDSEERCRVLEATCRNVLRQRYPEFEVIVSDNAGPISAEEALASIADERLNIYRNDKNLGMSGSVNLCVERCRYEIIKLNCDDDLLHPDSLRISVPWVNDETLVITDMEKFIIGEEPLGMKYPAEENAEVIVRSPGYRSDFWKITYDALPGDTLMTKKLFQEVGGYHVDAGVEDWDFAVRARLHRTVLNIKCVLCYQGVWSSSLTERMLATDPYYFPTAGLYTQFGILRDPVLTLTQRLHVLGMLLYSFLFSTLRLLKNLHQAGHRTSYKQYCNRWVELIRR